MTTERDTRTALRWLLGQGKLGPPYECCDCPFGTPDPDSSPPNYADPGEGNYLCALLGAAEVSKRNHDKRCWTYGRPTVWGENPKCTSDDWRVRACVEVGVPNDEE